MIVFRFPAFMGIPKTYLPVYAFAFILAVIVIFTFAFIEAKKRNYSWKRLLVFMILCYLSGMASARLFYVLFFRSMDFQEGLMFFFDLSRSGLASTGGFFGIALVCLLYSRSRDIWVLLDIASIGMMLSMAIGRIGCFAAACCHGVASNVSWAIFQHDAWRHPTQLYDMANALFVFGIVQRLRIFPGSVFLANVGLYSLGRFVIEFFRIRPMVWFLSFSQWFYLGILFFTGYLFLSKYRTFRCVLD